MNIDYAPIAPLPVGAPCQDGIASSGFIIPFPISTAFIPDSDLPTPDPGPQRTPVTCWAASIAYVMAYFDHPVDQNLIVQRYFPAPQLGSPQAMADALNNTWTDSNGTAFSITSRITNISGVGLPSHAVENSDVVDAITNNTPVFYGDQNHAMVLVKIRYWAHPNGVPPTIVDGVVWDPNPVYHVAGKTGYRIVSGAELRAIFVAIPSLQ